MSYLLETDFLLKAMGAVCLQRGASSFSAVATDSRQALKNQVFFALKGPFFDGHDFLNQAQQQGATAFVISDKQKAQTLLKNKNLSVFLVSDTVKALQNLAQLWTKEMKTKVLAITGSNGKTTTRNFTQTLLSSLSPFASPKSYNNHIGVPLSLLSVNRKSAILIQEIGSNHPGEIAHLTLLCDPIVSAVTMVGFSHLEALNSIELVAKEKQQIYLKSPKAFWLFNRDNFYTEKMFQEWGSSHQDVLTFSSVKKELDIGLQFEKETAQSSLIKGHIASVESKTKVLFSGKHNLENLMCACALALAVGLKPHQIWDLIPQCELPAGRGKWFQKEDKNISIFFDAYNANPSSMKCFLDSCSQFSLAERRVFVIGDMKELGEDSIKHHKQLASHPALLESRLIVFVGEYAELIEDQLKQKGFKGRFVGSKVYDRNILSLLKEELTQNDFLAIKASRSLKLEKLLFDLTGEKAF